MTKRFVTPHIEVYKAESPDGTRYFPATSAGKQAALRHDYRTDPVKVTGFAVQDSSISRFYYVALYATLAEAEAHAPPAPEEQPAQLPTEDGEFNGNEEEETAAEKVPGTEEDRLPFKGTKHRK